jgi:predicted Zn-dependent protease
MIPPLELHDQRHLEAAQGWFELGNCVEASNELDEITAQMRGHPSVLEVRYEIYAAAKKWEYAAEIAKAISELNPGSPFGWVHHAYALHELRRTQEVQKVLLPVVDRFPKEYIMRYNLACYECRLGRLEQAKSWLEKACVLGDPKKIKEMALNDPDLEPLWRGMGMM